MRIECKADQVASCSRHAGRVTLRACWFTQRLARARRAIRSSQGAAGANRGIFRQLPFGQRYSNCRDGSFNIAQVSFREARHKIEPALALAATGNAQQRGRLARSLTAYRDEAHPRGFDAALFVDAKDEQIQFFGFSGDGRAKPYKASLALTALKTPSQLQEAMYRALGELPVLEAS